MWTAGRKVIQPNPHYEIKGISIRKLETILQKQEDFNIEIEWNKQMIQLARIVALDSICEGKTEIHNYASWSSILIEMNRLLNKINPKIMRNIFVNTFGRIGLH